MYWSAGKLRVKLIWSFKERIHYETQASESS